MTTLREVAQQALEACTDVVSGWESLAPLSVRRAAVESLDALRAALAEPVQEPVAWIHADPDKPGLKFLEWREDAFGYDGEWIKTPLYTAPSQHKPLTDEEIWRTYKNLWVFHPAEEPRLAGDVLKFARAIERAHGIGGTNESA